VENTNLRKQVAQTLHEAFPVPATTLTALLVLMSAIENSTHPKAIANAVKYAAFVRCGELNVDIIVENQVAVFERDLVAQHGL
jgi:hypothetical protein